jgi:hypothetical protein
VATQRDFYPTRIGSILASADDGTLTPIHIYGGRAAEAWRRFGGRHAACPKMSQKAKNLRQKRHRKRPALRDKHLSSGIMTDFDDNGFNGIVAFWTQQWRRERKTVDRN